MKKIIIFIFLSLLSIEVFSLDFIDVQIIEFRNYETSFSINIMVTNNSSEIYWFHFESSEKRVWLEYNILYFAPNYPYNEIRFAGVTNDFFLRVIEINPSESVNISFDYELHPSYSIIIDSMSNTIRRRPEINYLSVQYINLTLVFFCQEIDLYIDPSEYINKIHNEGYVKTIIFDI